MADFRMPSSERPVRILRGDLLEWLPQIPDLSVDAVVTDPPYNVGLLYDSDESCDKRFDYQGWCRIWFKQLRRISRGPVCISVGMSNLSDWASIEPPDWWMAWLKPSAMGRCRVGFNNWEPIAVYGKPYKKGCDVIRAVIRPREDVGNHPCPKPLAWATKQLEMFVPPKGTVLDPFLGSGTVAVAAVEQGMLCLGIEQDQKYAESAIQRVKRAIEKNTERLF